MLVAVQLDGLTIALAASVRAQRPARERVRPSLAGAMPSAS